MKFSSTAISIVNKHIQDQTLRSSFGSSSELCKWALTDAVSLKPCHSLLHNTRSSLAEPSLSALTTALCVWSESYTPSLPFGRTSNTADSYKWRWSGNRVESGLCGFMSYLKCETLCAAWRRLTDSSVMNYSGLRWSCSNLWTADCVGLVFTSFMYRRVAQSVHVLYNWGFRLYAHRL